MCHELTTSYSCNHKKVKLTHCKKFDPQDNGLFVETDQCLDTVKTRKDRDCLCKTCDEKLSEDLKKHKMKMEKIAQSKSTESKPCIVM